MSLHTCHVNNARLLSVQQFCWSVSPVAMASPSYQWVSKSAPAVWDEGDASTHSVQLTMSTYMYCYHCISTLHVARVNEWPWGGGGISNGYTYYTCNQPSLSFPFTPLIVHAGCMQPFSSKSQHSVAGGVASLCETSPFQCQPVHLILRTTAGEAELTQCT